MATPEEEQLLVDRALQEWCTRNNSLIVTTPAGKVYGLFFEPDGEAPQMQYMGSSPVRAYAFVRNHPTNRYK